MDSSARNSDPHWDVQTGSWAKFRLSLTIIFYVAWIGGLVYLAAAHSGKV
jgi:hypothetical protein